MLGRDLNKPRIIDRRACIEDNSLRTLIIRKPRSTLIELPAGTNAITTTKKSNIFHPFFQNLNPDAMCFKVSSKTYTYRAKLSNISRAKRNDGDNDLFVSRPSDIAFKVIKTRIEI